jgi:predicted metallo-beta-lactamase superfamily hydrolase
MFARTGGKYAAKTSNADGQTFVFGETELKFSEPVFHGPENSEMGWVLMVTISFKSEKFLFAPDVQGPMSARPLEIILQEHPQLLMIGGPPLYLAPSRVSESQIDASLANLDRIVQQIPHVILDHHVLRDEEWQQKIVKPLYESYRSGSTLQTAAEYAGAKNCFLEAGRKKLFQENPPSKEFEAWMKLGEEKRKFKKPPV